MGGMRALRVRASRVVAIWFFAVQCASAEGGNADIAAAANQATISVGGMHQNYKEFNDGITILLPSVLDSELGSLLTFEVGASRLTEKIFYEVQVGIAAGTTTYTGYLQDLGPPVVYTPYVGKTANFIVGARGRVGIPFRPAAGLLLVPYAEVGEHLWRRDLGYVEDYSHFLIGVGGKLYWNPAPRVVVEAGLGTGTTFLANMTLDDLDFELGGKPWHHGLLAIDYRLDERWHLRLSSEYRRWQYGQSPVVAGFIEPRSESVQATYLISVGYSLLR